MGNRDGQKGESGSREVGKGRVQVVRLKVKVFRNRPAGSARPTQAQR